LDSAADDRCGQRQRKHPKRPTLQILSLFAVHEHHAGNNCCDAKKLKKVNRLAK
jgi:hypothetical protein